MGHQQERKHLLAPKRSPDPPVLTPERSHNKFFSRNDPEGDTPVLDLTGCAAEQGVLFAVKIIRQGITIDKKIMRQGIMWKDAF